MIEEIVVDTEDPLPIIPEDHQPHTENIHPDTGRLKWLIG